MSGIELVKFGCDYHALTDLINTSWAQEHDSHWNYTPELLEYFFQHPDVDHDLCFAAYSEGKIVSFLLAKKKTIIFDGKTWQGMLYTLAATDPDFSMHFPYLKIKNKCVFDAIEKGCDVAFGYTAHGIKNGHIEEFFAQNHGFDCKVANKFSYFILDCRQVDILNYKPVDFSFLSFDEFNAEHLDSTVEVVHDALRSRQAPMYELPSRETLSHIFAASDYTGGFYVEHGSSIGVVSYFLSGFMSDQTMLKTVALDNLFLDALDIEVKVEVMRKICHHFIQRGYDTIFLADTGFSDISYLENLGFKKNTGDNVGYNLYVTSFNPELSLYCLDGKTPFHLEIL